MKNFLLGTVALVALGATVPALAADLGTRAPYYAKAPAYVAPIYNWTGFYIGGHIGGEFGGNNSFAGVRGYAAGPGFDIASGWGTINATGFVPALAAAVSDSARQ